VWVGGQRHAPSALPPVKRNGTHCIGAGWAPGSVYKGAEKRQQSTQQLLHYTLFRHVNTLRTGSFKLFKRPFPGFLTILTL